MQTQPASVSAPLSWESRDFPSELLALSNRLFLGLELAALHSDSETRKKKFQLWAKVAWQLHASLSSYRYGEK